MITCRTVTGWHTEAAEGALSAWQRLRYRFHMGICPNCKAYAHGLDVAKESLAALPPEPAPDAVKRAALERLRKR
jgi:anti-sigma factor RsiW